MLAYILRRAGVLAASLVAASVIIFVMIEIVPGDPASYMLGIGAAPDTLAALRAELGLDQPKVLRYLQWFAGMLTGDFGISYTYQVPVRDLVMDRLWISLPLAVLALVLSVVLAIPAGMIAAVRQGKTADWTVMGVTQLGLAIPNFWFAMILVVIFSLKLGWFSAGGFPGWEQGLGAGFKALVLPAIALALPGASILARVMRSALLETLGQDYIRTARAKGLSRSQTLWRHALRNGFIPALTIIGLQFSFLIAGAIIIENVFFLPGLGRLIFHGITQRDLIVVESVVMLLVFAVICVTFLVDVAYGMIDPRIRRGHG
ncbi:MAG: ABC transporter permease [Pseudomonadota bacterium]